MVLQRTASPPAMLEKSPEALPPERTDVVGVGAVGGAGEEEAEPQKWRPRSTPNSSRERRPGAEGHCYPARRRRPGDEGRARCRARRTPPRSTSSTGALGGGEHRRRSSAPAAVRPQTQSDQRQGEQRAFHRLSRREGAAQGYSPACLKTNGIGDHGDPSALRLGKIQVSTRPAMQRSSSGVPVLELTHWRRPPSRPR